MSEVACEGWWEQAGYGRQPMEQLRLSFRDGQISGSGVDVIGPFTFSGRLDVQAVAMVKQYLGKHRVDYVGSFDGEGTFWGNWSIGPFGGPWRIRVVSALQDAEPVRIAAHVE